MAKLYPACKAFIFISTISSPFELNICFKPLSRIDRSICKNGAAAPFLHMDLSILESGLRQIFGSKGEEIVEMNMKALHAGYNFAMENK